MSNFILQGFLGHITSNADCGLDIASILTPAKYRVVHYSVPSFSLLCEE